MESESEDERDKRAMKEFFSLKRNYIILTNSGKPVFSYKGDMYTLSSIYATLYAMISKVGTYRFDRIDMSDKDYID